MIDGGSYDRPAVPLSMMDQPLAPPPPEAVVLDFELGTLCVLRDVVRRVASGFGIEGPQADGFVLAVHELAANSIRHGGGRGTLRMWGAAGEVVAEVQDRGGIAGPVSAAIPPGLWRESGRGMLLVHELCDLVDIRSLDGGSVVRVSVRRR